MHAWPMGVMFSMVDAGTMYMDLELASLISKICGIWQILKCQTRFKPIAEMYILEDSQ